MADDLVNAHFVVRFSKDDSMAGLFAEGKSEPVCVMPVQGAVDEERRARLYKLFIELLAAFVDADGVTGLGMVAVNENNEIVSEGGKPS
jgi:hypothetical protein